MGVIRDFEWTGVFILATLSRILCDGICDKCGAFNSVFYNDINWREFEREEGSVEGLKI